MKILLVILGAIIFVFGFIWFRINRIPIIPKRKFPRSKNGVEGWLPYNPKHDDGDPIDLKNIFKNK